MVINQTSHILKRLGPFASIKTKGPMSKNLMIKPSKVYWLALMKTYSEFSNCQVCQFPMRYLGFPVNCVGFKSLDSDFIDVMFI